MKTRILLSRIIVVGCILTMILSGVAGQLMAADKAEIAAIVKSNNSFALDLYSKLAKDPGNLFFSPYSISSALAMTYAGARGETAKQMSNTLHFSLAAEKLHPAISDLMGTFNTGGKNYQLSVANALWGQTGYKFQPDFLNITNKYYGAGFKEVDYVNDGAREQTRQTINKWVESKTNNKIKELIKPKILTALTRLVLTNAIYFKGKWETQFDPKRTKEMPFYVTPDDQIPEFPMMRRTGDFKYTENNQAQIVELPYTGGNLSMVILLPKPNSGMAKLEGALGNIPAWISQLSKQKIKVILPRFKLEKDFLLNGKLQELGMKDAFNESTADFSGMTPGRKLYITKVIHKAYVEVNEEGTEAAAATAVVMGTKSAQVDKPVVFRANRPFLFLIRDLRSGTILFMGKLVDPS
jgi:serpin B